MKRILEHRIRPAWPVVLLLMAICGGETRVLAVEPSLKVAGFVADVSPPLGQPVGLGFVASALTKEHPLLAKGIILEGSGQPVVLCAIDWMEFHNSALSLL